MTKANKWCHQSTDSSTRVEGQRLNSSPIGFPHALDFLEARRLDSKSEPPEREDQVDIVLSFTAQTQKSRSLGFTLSY